MNAARHCESAFPESSLSKIQFSNQYLTIILIKQAYGW